MSLIYLMQEAVVCSGDKESGVAVINQLLNPSIRFETSWLPSREKFQQFVMDPFYFVCSLKLLWSVLFPKLLQS
jgi:hypothetical protein